MSVQKYYVNLISNQDISVIVTSPLEELLFSCLFYSGTVFAVMCYGPTVKFLTFQRLLTTLLAKLLPILSSYSLSP